MLPGNAAMRTSALAKPVRLGLSLHDTPDDFESSDEEKDRPSITASPQKNSKVVRKEKNNALEFHLYAAKKAPLELPSLGQRSPTTPDSVHSAIQTTWGLFNGMSDSQRNQLLAGLLSRCSSKQVEYICTMLNLKMVDVNSKHRIEKLVPQEIARKFPARKNVLKGIRGKEEVYKDDTASETNALQMNDAMLNPNIYIKLLNSKIDPDLIAAQLSGAGPAVAGFVVNFLTSRVKKLQSLLQCMHDIATEVDVIKSIKLLTTCILEATEASQVTVYFTETNLEKLSVRTSTWQKEGVNVPLSKVFGIASLSKGESVNVFNIKSSEFYTDEIEAVFKDKFEVDCIMSTPIFGDGMRVSGIIEIINKRSGNPFFSAEDEFMLKSIASMGTLMFNHANIKQSAMKKTDDIKVFLNTASMMSSAELDMGDLINVIMKTAQQLVNAERCAMFLIDKEKEELWSRLARGASEIRFPMRLGIAGHVAMTGETLNISDAYADSRFNRTVDMKTGYRTRNILCVPMRNATGEILGVTQVINKLPDSSTFNKEDEQQLYSFSALAAVTIEKSRVFKELQESLEEMTRTKTHLQLCVDSSGLVTMTLTSDGKLGTIHRPELLGIGADSVKSMKLTSYEFFIGADNPVLSSDISKAQKSVVPISGRNYRFRMGSQSWNVHYSIAQMKDDSATKSAPTSSDVKIAIFIEIVDDERIIFETLGRCLPPQLVHQAMQPTEITKLRGNCQNLTLISASITNFNAILETLEPQQAVYVLNSFYSVFVECIHAEAGVVDKFTGSSVFAFFGLPSQSSLDTEKANLAALAIRNACTSLNLKFSFEGLPAMKFGVGMSTEPAVSAVVGGGVQFEYTVLGDCRETSKRLQDLTPIYGTHILICEETRQIVKDIFHTREVDMVYVKGRLRPVVIFEVMGTADSDLAHDMMTTFICYELGLSEYRARNWQAALMHFKKAITLTDDKPARTFVERCRAYIDGKKEIPPMGWDGAYID